jgi:hypothetical protein
MASRRLATEMTNKPLPGQRGDRGTQGAPQGCFHIEKIGFEQSSGAYRVVCKDCSALLGTHQSLPEGPHICDHVKKPTYTKIYRRQSGGVTYTVSKETCGCGAILKHEIIQGEAS